MSPHVSSCLLMSPHVSLMSPHTFSSLQDALSVAGISAAETLNEARLITCHALKITRTQLFLREIISFTDDEWRTDSSRTRSPHEARTPRLYCGNAWFSTA